MQKFVVKKICRSTNITISEDTALSQCEETRAETEKDLEISNIRMSGYLKKKRNRVGGGWRKMYFVLQNSLLMSYNSKDEYEKKLVSFKDVICLVPSSTVLIPSLEPRFTIASNLNTFYTFRCDDNTICSKWISAILECLNRELPGSSQTKGISSAKNFSSQQNISHHPKPICGNHSWENLPNNNWIVNHNGRILLELNYLNCNRAKLPISNNTAQILQKYSDAHDVIKTKHVNFLHDENQNLNIRNDHDEELNRAENFRLHNVNAEQSEEVKKMNEIFGRTANCGGNEYEYSMNENGIETQVMKIMLGDESVDYSSVSENYQSVDSKRFNNKLVIEDGPSDYAEINGGNDCILAQNHNDGQSMPYATVDYNKKKEDRLKRMQNGNLNTVEPKTDDQSEDTIYQDIDKEKFLDQQAKESIYEIIEIPLRPSRKSRSLVFKNWSRIQLFGSISQRFKDTRTREESQSQTALDNLSKQKKTLTLSDFSKSMRKKAAKIYRKKNSAQGSNQEINDSET